MDLEEKQAIALRAQALSVELAEQRRNRGLAAVPERRPTIRTNVDALDLVMMLSQIKYNARGDAVCTFVIPVQYTEIAKDLPSFLSKLAHVAVQKWSPVDLVTGTDAGTG